MKKTLLASCLLALALAVPGSVSAETAAVATPYRAIVKIKTFILGPDYLLMETKEGTGVLLSSDGVVLTNHHVVTVEDSFDSTERTAGYQVCVTEAVDNEPDCSYTARVIAKDKDSDIALLKIASVAGLSGRPTFPFLDLALTDSVQLNDEVLAFGYPAIGGDTISVTGGIVSGKQDKYGKQWIKSDALVSFGSSGGALFNDAGRVIGITTEVHSDLSGSLGYAINASSILSWVNANRTRAATATALQAQTDSLTVKEKRANDSDIFHHDIANYSITKPAEWRFTYGHEDLLTINKPSDDEGGYVSVAVARYPFAVSLRDVDLEIKRQLSSSQTLATVQITKNEEVTINGVKAKLIQMSAPGVLTNEYYIPNGNYFLQVTYGNGKDDKDSSTVRGIVNSIRLTPVPAVSPSNEYVNQQPTFSMKVTSDWAIQRYNSKSEPVLLHHRSKLALGSISVIKKTEDERGMSNDQFLSRVISSNDSRNAIAANLNIKTEAVSSNAHHVLNEDIRDVVMVQGKTINVATSQVVKQEYSYAFSIGDYWVIVGVMYFGSDADGFNAVLESWGSQLQSLSLSAKPRTVSAAAATKPVAKPQPVAAPAVRTGSLANRMRGKILLQVEGRGEAWYVRPNDGRRVYMKDGTVAYQMMRSLGSGISNVDLEKIPVGIEARFTDTDQDSDGLPDRLEGGLKTDPANPDSDGDGVNDGTEVLTNGTNPLGSGRLTYSSSLVSKMLGKILLQVESRGEAWYLNPNDGKRYYMKDGDAAYQIMRFLSLGISNRDLEQVQVGE